MQKPLLTLNWPVSKMRRRKTFGKNREAVENHISTLIGLIKSERKRDSTDHMAFYNTSLFISIVHRDLIFLAEKLVFSSLTHEKSIYARFLALTIYEYLIDINSLIGNKLFPELRNNNFDEFVNEFKKVTKKFTDIKTKYDTTLKMIRNETTAHKNKDALLLENYIRGISSTNIKELVMEVIDGTTLYLNISTKVSESISSRRDKKKSDPLQNNSL